MTFKQKSVYYKHIGEYFSPIYATLAKNGEYFSPQDYTQKGNNLIEGNGAGFHSAIKKIFDSGFIIAMRQARIRPDKTEKRFKRPTFSVTAYTDVRLFCQNKKTGFAPEDFLKESIILLRF